MGRVPLHGMGHLVAIWVVSDDSSGRGHLVRLFTLFQSSYREWGWGNAAGALFLFVLVPYAFFILPDLAIRKHFRRDPKLAGPFTYVFSEAGIDVSTPGSQTHLDWETISRVSETSSWFLLYPRTFSTQTIPKRFLGTADQQVKLRTPRTYAKNARLQLQG